MNRLKVTDSFGNILLGGMPLNLEDFVWLDSCIRDAFKGLTSAFGGNFTLSGCELDLFAGTYAAGYVVMDGEILKVDGGSIPALSPGDILYWTLDLSYDSGGTETFGNGNVNDTYEYRKARMVAGTPSVGEMPITVPTLLDYISQYVQLNGAFALKKQEDWILVGTNGAPAFENGWVDYNSAQFGQLRFMKDNFGFVTITGAVGSGTVGSTTPIFHLPVGYRPAYQESYIVPADNLAIPGGNAFHRIIIYPDGKVAITAATAADFTGDNHFVGIPNLRFRVV